MIIIPMLVKTNEICENVAWIITHFPPISARLPSTWPPSMLLRMQKPKPRMRLSRLGTIVP